MSRLFALLVGINQYATEGAVPALRGCRADALAVRTALLRRGLLPEAHVLTLVDGEATRAAFIRAWRSHLVQQVEPGDTAWFHFSGHGSRARSSDPTERDGYDETLVLWDSRSPGGWDLLDKELAVLIGEVEAKGAQLVLFLDCCHAGGATRAEGRTGEAAVRACLPDARPRPAATLLGKSTRGDTASSTALLVAACLETQKARETAQPSADAAAGNSAPLWHGALTWAFLRTLDEAPARSWAASFDAIAARVRHLYPQQTPQLTGPVAMPLFGGAAAELVTAPALLVLESVAAAAGHLARARLDGGAALGLRPGARVRLLDGDDGQPATITEATLETAWAALDDGAAPPPAQGTRARLVAFADEEGGAAQAGVFAGMGKLRTALRAGASPLLRVARARDAHFCVWAQPVGADGAAQSGVQICDGGGEPLAWVPTVEGETGGETARLIQALEHLALVRRIRALRNLAPDAPLRDALEVGPPLAVKPSRNSAAAFGQATPLSREGAGAGAAGLPVAAPGARVGLQLRNRSDGLLYIAVLALLPDWSIRRIVPDDTPRQALAAGATLGVQLRTPELPPGAARAIFTLKVFASTAPLSWDALQLPALLQGPVRLTAPVRSGGPLDALLDHLCRAAPRTRSAAEDATLALWHTWEVTLALLPAAPAD